MGGRSDRGRTLARARVCAAAAVAVALSGFAARSWAATPGAADRLLALADLEGKSLCELEVLRATPRARAGLVFLEWWLRDHFEKQSWYRPGRYDEARLTAVDRKNLATIERYVDSIPRSALLARWHALMQAHRWAGAPGGTELAFSAVGRMLARYPQTTLFGSGPISLWGAVHGERLARMEWPAKLVARGYFPTPFGPRLGTEEDWPSFLGVRFVGSDLAAVTNYHALVGAPFGAQPKRGLLVGPNWNKDGSRDRGIDAACIAPDGSTLVTLDDLRLRTFDLVKGKAADTSDFARSAATPYVSGTRCEFFDDSRALVQVEHGGDSHVWDVKARSASRLAVPRGMSRVAPGGELLGLWGARGDGSARVVTIWDLRGVPKQSLRLAGTEGATGAWFTPDRKRVVVAGPRGALTLFDLASGAPARWRGDVTFLAGDSIPRQPDSLNGQLLPILVEDARETLERATVPDLVTSVAFSSDAARVAVAFESGRLELRDARTGARLPNFPGHEPWTDQDLWEASLLARRLGLRWEPEWPKPPQDVNPLDHLAALDHVLPDTALEPLSRLHLRLLRNTISARRGATFKAKTLVDSFAGASWYKPSSTHTDVLLTPADRANIRAIQRRESTLGGPLTEAEALKHTEFAIYSGMHDWRLIPQAPEPERTGLWQR